jgi:hypothetical protein
MYIKSCNLGQLLRPCLSNETGCSGQRVQGQAQGRASRSVSREMLSAGTKRSRGTTHPRESSEWTASLAPGVGKGQPTDRTHGSRCSRDDRAFHRHAQVVESPLHHWPLKEADRTLHVSLTVRRIRASCGRSPGGRTTGARPAGQRGRQHPRTWLRGSAQSEVTSGSVRPAAGPVRGTSLRSLRSKAAEGCDGEHEEGRVRAGPLAARTPLRTSKPSRHSEPKTAGVEVSCGKEAVSRAGSQGPGASAGGSDRGLGEPVVVRPSVLLLLG